MSTMSDNSSHVQTQQHTSTRTSDYHSAQSTCSRSTDSDLLESSESNAEALSPKILDYSSDLKECNVPNTGMCISSTVEPPHCGPPEIRTHCNVCTACGPKPMYNNPDTFLIKRLFVDSENVLVPLYSPTVVPYQSHCSTISVPL